MKTSRISALILSGLVWLTGGVMLLYKGLALITGGSLQAIYARKSPLFGEISHEQGAILLIALGLAIGFLKGRFAMRKAAKKAIARIVNLEDPIKLSELYPKAYILLLLGMVSIGMLLRFLPIAQEVRGVIDVAIGSALTQGSLEYIKASLSKGSTPTIDG